MARYIDAEKLCKSLRDMAFYQNPYKQSTILGVVSSIENFPTADVVPKSEALSEFLRMVENICKYEECLSYQTIEQGIKRQMTMEEAQRALRECPDCKHFVGCECFDGKTCDSFERKESK